MTPPTIETPRGAIVINKGGKAELRFNADFRPRWHLKYSDAQKWLDNEVLQNCDPYIPLLTGMLIKSGILGTDVGSGTVQWIAPYARAQYYGKRKPGSLTGPLRGPQWFERSKSVNRTRWVNGARKIMSRS